MAERMRRPSVSSSRTVPRVSGQSAQPGLPRKPSSIRQGRLVEDQPIGLADLACALVLALVLSAAALIVAHSIDARFLTAPVGNDVWFEADLPAVSDGLLHRWSDQSRNTRHPLFPLLATTPAHVLRLTGLPERMVLQALIAAIAGIWGFAFYALLRLATGRRADAMVFAALGCTSSAAMFWLPVPETYSWGSTTIVMALALCAYDRDRRLHESWYVAAAALTLSVTTTNWVAGGAAAIARNPPRRAAQILANAFVIVVAFWAVQRAIYPTAEFFIGYANEHKFLFSLSGHRPMEVFRALLFHGVVMPAVQIAQEPKWGAIMSVQRSALGSSGPWGIAATLLWIPLIALAARALTSPGIDRGLRAVLGLTFVGQLLVYLVYGDETFLYSFNITPVLIAAAALATRTPQRRLALGLAVGLTAVLAVNNAAQLQHALRFFNTVSK